MFIKPLLILSITCNIIGFNLFSDNFDRKISETYSRESYSTVSADTFDPQFTVLPNVEVKTNSNNAYINSRQYVLVDGDSGVLLLGRDSEKEVPIASTTKIMTTVIALENYSLDEVVKIKYDSTIQPGADSYLRTNEEITVSELLHCLLIKSGNDAAHALAVYMDKVEGIDIGEFVQKMNNKAVELNMRNTYYKDPAGLDTSGYSSAYDLSIITRYALKNPVFRQIVATKNYVATNTTKSIFHQLENSNRLVNEYNYPGAIGVKTGFMPEAGHCLVGAAERGEHQLIAVILSTYADTANASADEAKKLLDWGFDNIVWNEPLK